MPFWKASSAFSARSPSSRSALSRSLLRSALQVLVAALAVAERLVGLGDHREHLLGDAPHGVAGAAEAVRVRALGEREVGLADLVVGRGLGDAEHAEVVAAPHAPAAIAVSSARSFSSSAESEASSASAREVAAAAAPAGPRAEARRPAAPRLGAARPAPPPSAAGAPRARRARAVQRAAGHELDHLDRGEHVEQPPRALVEGQQVHQRVVAVDAREQLTGAVVEVDVLEAAERLARGRHARVAVVGKERVDDVGRHARQHAARDQVRRARLEAQRVAAREAHAAVEAEAAVGPAEDLEQLLLGLGAQREGEILLVEHVHRDQDLSLEPLAALHPQQRLVHHVEA